MRLSFLNIIFLLLGNYSLAQWVDEQDSLELVKFYNSTDGKNWTNNSGWLTEQPVKNWYGIVLSSTGTNVTGIMLANNNLKGIIIDINLPSLDTLYVNLNQLTGNIPNFNLPNIQALNLSHNKLTGNIPNFDLPNLQSLNLGADLGLYFTGNQLSGTIPNFDLPKLRNLYLSGNHLSGIIPNFNLPKLEQLDLNYNQLSGAIPNFNLPSLQRLWLRANQLTNTIPQFDLPNLQQLVLDQNELFGSIPNFHLPNLQRFYAAINQLSGTIPNFDLPNLQRLVLDSNRLSGDLPNLTGLSLFGIGSNKFTFTGIEHLAQIYSSTQFNYHPQDSIEIQSDGNKLYVSTGGTLSNNTYKWFINGELVYSVTGDSTFEPSQSGDVTVYITNSIATQLILYGKKKRVQSYSLLNPYPSLINSDGTLSSSLSGVDMATKVTGASADGITKLIIYGDHFAAPVTFQLSSINDGTLHTPGDETGSSSVTINPDNNGKIIAIYTAPDGVGITSEPIAERAINILAITGNESQPIKLKLVTPPIVLVHGMWSSPAVWTEDGFLQSLSSKGFKNIQSANYKDYAFMTFDPLNNESIFGRSAIYSSLLEGLNYYSKEGIVASQVDVVGHSLGGLMARSFAQTSLNLSKRNYMKGFIHKFISIGTPHFGSPLGPILYNANQAIRLSAGSTVTYITNNLLSQYLSSFLIGSVHKDFSTDIANNPALQHLQNTADSKVNIKKVHAIVGIAGTGPEIAGWEKLIRLLTRSDLAVLLDTDHHDLIVGEQSQLGGLSYGSGANSFSNSAHSKIPLSNVLGLASTTETSNPAIFEKVGNLLLSNDNNDFAAGFPAPSQVMHRPFRASEMVTKASETLDPVITSNDSAVIRLNPNSRNIIVDSLTSSIVISFDTLHGAVISDPVCIIPGIGIIDFPNHAPYSINIPLHVKQEPRRINFCILARNRNDVLLADTSTILIKPKGKIFSFGADPQNITLDSIVREQRIHCSALYGSESSGILYTVDSASGVSFSTYGNKISVSNNGIVRGIQEGTDTVFVSYLGYIAKVPVTIAVAIGSLPKYSTSIAFDLADKQTLDLPFVLTGTSSSGEGLNYTSVSGPVQIQNNIVFITGVGTATIQAFSPANAYFDSASVVRTFTITASTPTTYEFTGNGNWSNALNWSGGQKPPNVLPSGSEIIINPSGSGECIIDIQQRITSGAKLTVRSGKRINILNNLIIKY